MNTKIYILIYLLTLGFVQQNTAQNKPKPAPPTTEARDFKSEVSAEPSTSKRDSSLFQLPQNDAYTISTDSIQAEVDYEATDSMIFDVQNNKLLLYGQAKVTYTSINLVADFIELDWNTNIVKATGLPDNKGVMQGRPNFKDGEQDFTAGEIKYNFNTQKGIVTDVSTTQAGLYVRGERAKFYTANDSLENDVVYNSGAIFTSCDHDEPHFGIRCNKVKIVANKIAVLGPSNLEVMGVPTPLWLPFGFFPVTPDKQTGLLFPSSFDYRPDYGFGLNRVGWYFPINDNIDLQLTGDIYFKGTYRLRAQSSYMKRYKYRGNFKLEYANLNDENAFAERQRRTSWIINLRHNQDSKAHPSRKLGGSIDITTNNAYSENYNDPSSVLTQSYSSNFAYSESFPNQPFNLSLALSHSQNTKTGVVRMQLPKFDFKTNTLYPFQLKSTSSAQDKWFEKFSIRYTGQAQNEIRTTDSLLFEKETWQNLNYGAKHNVSLSSDYKVLKHFNFSPSANYEEIWYFKSMNRTFDSTNEIQYDEVYINQTEENPDGELILVPVDTTFGFQNIDTLSGFKALRKFDVGANLSSRVIGTWLFAKGPVKGIRSTFNPSFGFSFNPNYGSDKFNYYQTVDTDSRPDYNDPELYSLFLKSPYSSGLPSAPIRQMALTYGMNTAIEAKVFSKKDSSDQIVQLLRSLRVNGRYNFAADSLKFSDLTMSTGVNLFKNVVKITYNSNFRYYDVDEDGRKIDQLLIQKNGQIAELDRALLRFSVGASIGQIKELLFKEKPEEPEIQIDAEGDEVEAGNDFGNGGFSNSTGGFGGKDPDNDFTQALQKFRINYNYALTWDENKGVDTFFVSSNVIDIRGSLDLTKNWKLNIGSFGYDFRQMKVTFPSIGISRDIHCWNMSFNWQPERGTYGFYLNVDPGSFLDAIKIPYQKGPTGVGGFGGF